MNRYEGAVNKLKTYVAIVTFEFDIEADSASTVEQIAQEAAVAAHRRIRKVLSALPGDVEIERNVEVEEVG